MKTYTNVQDWLASNPSEELVKRVLNLINRAQATETRKEVYAKKATLRKMERAIKSLKEVNLPTPQQIVNEVKSLQTEIAEMEKELPKPKPKAKK